MCESHKAITAQSTIIEESSFEQEPKLLKKVSQISCATKESLQKDLWRNDLTYCRNIIHSEKEHADAEEKLAIVSLCKQRNDAIKYVLAWDFIPKKEHIAYLILILEKITFSDIKDFTLLQEEKISWNDETFFTHYYDQINFLLENLEGDRFDVDYIWWSNYLSSTEAEKKFTTLRKSALEKLKQIVSNFVDNDDASQEYLELKQLAHRTYEMKNIL